MHASIDFGTPATTATTAATATATATAANNAHFAPSLPSLPSLPLARPLVISGARAIFVVAKVPSK